jgi:Asp-tRNA(Asn)/Glu-tRNA(Gln) amidotransferase A subunit family amidase
MAALDELCFLPAVKLAGIISEREVSPVEVTRAFLERIDRLNPSINAFATLVPELALAAAQRSEEALLRHEPIGPLHGVPFTLKDVNATKGIRTTYGSKAFADNIPQENSIAADRLFEAGAILLGKTTTPEFGNKGHTESPLLGVTRNPWNTDFIAGGSSGGACAAAAAGLSPLAEGSDAAGSIRIPASICGVVGLKPSLGRVPIYPRYTVFESLAFHGPIARNVPDVALMLTTMAGPDDRFPFSLMESGVDYLKAIEGASVRGWKIAYSRDLGLGPVDQEVVARTDTAARVFAGDLGANVEEATPDAPNPESAMLDMWNTLVATTGLDLALSKVGPEDVDPSLLGFIEEGSKLSAVDYYRSAMVFRSNYYQRMISFFKDYDLLITPTLAVPPFPHPGWERGPSEIAGQKINPMLGWLLTYPFNMTGQPAITVPCGFSEEGLPIGLQIVGRRNADIDVLQAAAAYEEAAPWSGKRPPVD